MKVGWTRSAKRDRSEIFDYLTARDRKAAIRIDQRFSAVAALLVDFPMAGHTSLIAGARELFPHPSYRLVYEIYGETIWRLTVVHTSRQWPPIDASGPYSQSAIGSRASISS